MFSRAGKQLLGNPSLQNYSKSTSGRVAADVEGLRASAASAPAASPGPSRMAVVVSSAARLVLVEPVPGSDDQ
jgi:hypothetical protein